jgi:hypothetical protein
MDGINVSIKHLLIIFNSFLNDLSLISDLLNVVDKIIIKNIFINSLGCIEIPNILNHAFDPFILVPKNNTNNNSILPII